MQIRLAPENFKTRETAHTYLKEILHLPDYYGRNLDALYDCLCEIITKTTITVPRVIASDGYLGEYGKTMIAVFHDAAKEKQKITSKLRVILFYIRHCPLPDIFL